MRRSALIIVLLAAAVGGVSLWVTLPWERSSPEPAVERTTHSPRRSPQLLGAPAAPVRPSPAPEDQLPGKGGELPEGPYGYIEGTVIDEAGLPIANATLVAVDGTGEPGPRVTTDAAGAFALACNAAGPWRVDVVAVGYVSERTVATWAPGRLNVTLRSRGSLQFRLRPVDRSAPPEHATVTLQQRALGTGMRVVATRAGGGFAVQEVAPGETEVRVLVPGFLPLVRRVTVRSGESVDLGTLELARGLAIEGRVVDAAGDPVEAVLVRPDGDRDHQGVFTNAAGAFTVGPVPAGEVVLRVEGMSRYLDLVETVVVRDGGSPVVVCLRRGALVTGHVAGADIQGERRPRLRLLAKRSASQEVEWLGVDDSGAFRTRLGPGVYTLELLQPDAEIVLDTRLLELREGETRAVEFTVSER